MNKAKTNRRFFNVWEDELNGGGASVAEKLKELGGTEKKNKENKYSRKNLFHLKTDFFVVDKVNSVQCMNNV